MMQPLTPFGDSFDWRLGTDYLGLILDPKTSELLASGEIHPITLEEIPKALAQPTKDTSEKTPRLEITQNSSPSRHKIEEVVWSSICAAPPQFSLPPPELDDISLDHVSPIPLSHDLIHTSPITKAKRKKKKDLDSRNSPLAIANPSFEPLQGVESLYRRKKRMSQDEEMVTEVNPWSSSKKVKNIPISSHSFWMQRNELLTPNEELSIHEALRETSRCQNRENNFIHSATDSRISQNEIDHSTLQSNTDRYRHVGILKYQPYHLFNHLSPFDLR